MGDPTVYKVPKKGLPSRKPSERTKVKWRKHRDSVGKDPAPPKLKN